FFLCGLWHGASWTFVVWGLFHGTFLVLERLGLVEIMSHLRPTVRHVYTMAVVMVGWVFFRADSLAAAIAFLKAISGLPTPQTPPLVVSWYLTPELVLALIAGTIGSVPIVPIAEKWRESLQWPAVASALDVVAGVALSLVLAFSIIQCAAGSYNPFIY